MGAALGLESSGMLLASLSQSGYPGATWWQRLLLCGQMRTRVSQNSKPPRASGSAA